MNIEEMKQIARNDFYIPQKGFPPFSGRFRKRNRTTRITIYRLFEKFGFTCGAEIGVYRGKNAKLMFDYIPDLKLFLIDSWAAKASKRYHQMAIKAMEPYKDNVEFIKKTSMEAVKQFEDYSLDFVYIDAAHDFNNIMLDLIKWVPKVKIGGAVCGHDYNTPCTGVSRAVDSYTFAHGINQIFITREEVQNFLWIKEK